MKLSLCMIVKNEEATLPKCLSSVKNVVDEMVVLNTGYTDSTPQIAQKFGAKVHHFEWYEKESEFRMDYVLALYRIQESQYPTDESGGNNCAKILSLLQRIYPGALNHDSSTSRQESE